MSSVSSDLITGIIQRALVFVFQKLIPGIVADVGGIPGVILKAALGSQYAADLEKKLGGEVAVWTGDKITELEDDCKTWVESEFQKHPDFAKFIESVKPPAPVQFDLKDDELNAVLAAQKDGTLRAKLGLAS